MSGRCKVALHDLVRDAPQMLSRVGTIQLTALGHEVRPGSDCADRLALEWTVRLVVIEVKL